MIKSTLLLFFLFALSAAQAQKMPVMQSNWANNVVVNGKLNEWGDTLTHYFEDQDLYYSFANDDTYLYVAIRVKNKDKQMQAVLNGFRMTINRDGKKKVGPSLTFPVPDRAALRALSNQEFNKPEDLRKGALSAIRAYYVQGFSSILDGPISLDNSYGIKAAVLIDSTDQLCYESAIRLDQLNLPNQIDGFAINLKINGLIRTQYNVTSPMRSRRGSPYGYDPYGYDQRPRSVIQNRDEPGTWQYLQLAPKP